MDEVVKLPRVAISANDKLMILQARDKYVRSQRKKQTDIETAKIVIGNCPDMCPEYERYCRLDRNFVSTLEETNGIPDEHKMVKEYVRSGADQEEPLPYELRPPAVLERTMLYLATNVIDLIDTDEEVSAGEYYDFLWNRMRAIKKDITQQDLKSESSVLLMERCARFHIYSAHRFVEEEMGVFDSKMNNENLVKTMQSLKDLYDDLRLHNNIQCPNEPEFRCYDILLNLCNNDVLRGISKIRPSIRNSASVKFALKVQQAFSSNNFVKFFSLMKETNLLNACIMHRYFGMTRYSAFLLLRRAFTTPSQKEEYLPKHYIFDLLCFEQDEEFDEFCGQIEIEIDENDSVVLRRETRSQASLPADYMSKRSIEYIDAKKGRKRLSEIIYNERLQDNPYRKYQLQNSFDENGLLNDTEISLDDGMVKVDQKKVYAFADTKSKPVEASTQNKFAFKQEKPSIGPVKSLFSQSSNVFGKQSTFASAKTQSNEQSLFGKSPLFGLSSGQQSNLFTAPSDSQNLFEKKNSTNSSNLFSSQSASLFSKSNQEQKSTSENFLFKLPSNQPTSSTTQNVPSNLFASLDQVDKSKFSFKPIDQAPDVRQEQIKQPAQEQPKLSEDELMSLSGTIFESLMNEVMTGLVKKCALDACISDQSIQLANTIISEVVTQLIEKLCNSAFTFEKNRRQKLDTMIKLTSADMCNELIGEQVTRTVNLIARDVYLRELDAFILNKSELFADSYFEETFEQLVYEICYQTYRTELIERQRIVNYIREKRGWRLAANYFKHWKKRCDYLKRYRFLRDNFPASRMENNPPILKRVLSVPELNTFVQPLKRRFIEISNDVQFATHLNSTSLQTTRSSLCLDFATESRIQEELSELKEQWKKREKIDELSTKSKLDYAKRALDNLKKVSHTFNRSLEFARPFLNSDSKR